MLRTHTSDVDCICIQSTVLYTYNYPQLPLDGVRIAWKMYSTLDPSGFVFITDREYLEFSHTLAILGNCATI